MSIWGPSCAFLSYCAPDVRIEVFKYAFRRLYNIVSRHVAVTTYDIFHVNAFANMSSDVIESKILQGVCDVVYGMWHVIIVPLVSKFTCRPSEYLPSMI